MLSEYRQRFIDYQTEINREEYLFRSGRKELWEGPQLFREFSDLFRLQTVDELRTRSEEAPAKTDATSIKRLISFALEGNVLARVREIDEQIEAGDEDLRAERFDKLQDAARSLGYPNYLAFRHEMREVDYESVAAQGIALLSQTEEIAASARAAGMPADAAESVDDALVKIGALGFDPPPRILITGSLYLAGEVLAANGTELL